MPAEPSGTCLLLLYDGACGIVERAGGGEGAVDVSADVRAGIAVQIVHQGTGEGQCLQAEHVVEHARGVRRAAYREVV